MTNPCASILADEDPRLQEGLAAGAWAIECRRTAALSKDETLIREVAHRALLKALGTADAEQYSQPLMVEGRTIVTITAKEWHTWDYSRVDCPVARRASSVTQRPSERGGLQSDTSDPMYPW